MNGVQKSSVSIAYDELGRPCRTTYGSGSDAITESTTYTIQGWTASKWSDLLRQSWHYEDSSRPSWTGNITRWEWRHLAAAGESDSSGNAASYQQRSELFSYDGLNRLSGSAMTVGTGATAISDSRWSERNIRYDLDGNILHLERCKKQVFDQQFSEKLDSADFGKLVLHIVIDKAVMRQRAAALLLGA